MKLKQILSQNRRDFTAIYACEHCGHEVKKGGYDDTYFHQKVIPAMECPDCGKTAPEDYRAYAPKYPDWEVH